MFRQIAPIAMFALAALLPFKAAAQSSVALEGDVKVVRTVEVDGETRETFEAPDRVVPGDRLVFTTSYRNETGEQVSDFVVTNPLPDAVILAENGSFEVSVDGGASFGPLAAATIADAAGGTRPAELSDVTHLRWTLKRLEPGESGKINYLAVVR